MAKLRYITNGNQNLQGKSRVYFCGHPSDYGSTLQQIARDILETPNCVIWYDGEPDARWEEESHFSDLSNMQLFVVPVTEPFLYEPNRAFSKELPFAVRQHIPLLPIIEDSELESVFEEKCGRFQSLKKTVKGPEPLPYKERLRKYLSQTLIGDQLSQKVLNAFDAQIFLAYRKADRQYAHQFMRMVHECPRFRNVAIWYDEFLSTGENYTEEIDTAIQHSNVFAMVVTPNIVMQPHYNYVKENEYPAAAKQRKPVIPVEFLKTNSSALKKEYAGIPDCIPANGKDSLYAALESALVGIRLTEHIGRPERQFLLGLAYLGGIGLEKNLDYSLQYLSAAAEADFPEAMERLAGMYRYGEGVAPDLLTAVHWQSRLAWHYKNEYEKTGQRESGIHTVFEQHKLYEYLMEAGREDEALELCCGMRMFARELRKRYPRDFSAIECVTISLSDISDFLERKKSFKTSRKIQSMLLLLSKKLAQDTNLPDAHEDVSLNYQCLGSLSENCGDFASALKYYQKSLKISSAWKERDSSDSVYRRWLNDLYRVGHCLLALRQPKKAESYLKECYDGYASFQASGPELWRTCDALSGVCCQKHDLDRAEFYCGESIRAAREEHGIAGRRHLAASYGRKADILRAKNRPDVADCYRLALDMMQRIYAETGGLEDREQLSATWGMFGDYCLVVNDTASAKEAYQNSIGAIVNLPQDEQTWATESVLAQGFQRLGLIAGREGDIRQARINFMNSIEILSRAKKRFSDPSIPVLMALAKKALKMLDRMD